MRAFQDRFQDPNRVNLRKASRAALVVPAVFALLVVTGNTPSSLFAAFGSFSALVFSDFGGPRLRRFRAYLLLAVVGGALVALGTAFADTMWPAVAVTLVVAFAIAMFAALGGYFTASATAATLAFVLAVMSPGVEADLASRELGWILGVVAAGVAAIVLWPVHQRDRVRAAAATVLREAASALTVPAADRDLAALHDADAALTARAGVVYRPAGSIVRERALVALVIATRRLAPLLERVTTAERSPVADPTPEYTALAARVADSLAASGEFVARAAHDGNSVDALTAARCAHRRARTLGRVGAAVRRRRARRRRVRGDVPVAPALARRGPDRRRRRRGRTRHRAHARRGPGGGRERAGRSCGRTATCVRCVSATRRVPASVSRSRCWWRRRPRSSTPSGSSWRRCRCCAPTRSGTGATALQALVGALVGFGIAAALIETIGGDDTWLWVALPIVTFLAAYTPGAVNFVVGQAGFTVFVVVLFNILVPQGWRTGLVRVQDIAIGAGISVAVGALLWPRGARGVARRSFAELLRAGTAHLSVALDVTLRGRPGDVTAAATAVADARRTSGCRARGSRPGARRRPRGP